MIGGWKIKRSSTTLPSCWSGVPTLTRSSYLWSRVEDGSILHLGIPKHKDGTGLKLRHMGCMEILHTLYVVEHTRSLIMDGSCTHDAMTKHGYSTRSENYSRYQLLRLDIFYRLGPYALKTKINIIIIFVSRLETFGRSISIRW